MEIEKINLHDEKLISINMVSKAAFLMKLL